MTGTIRDMSWFDGVRARGYRAILLAGMILTAAGWALTARHGVDRHGMPLGTDFLSFWSAARLALAGVPEAAWDVARLRAVERTALPVDPGLYAFLYPPPFLLLCAPFGALAYLHALAAWLAAGLIAFLVAMRGWAATHRGWVASLLAFPAVLVTIGHGQNALLTAALLAGGLRLIDRRPWLAGALLGCLVVKPQLALALPVLVLASWQWRVVLGAAATAVALCLASLAAFGADAWRGFLADGAIGRAILEQGLVEPGKMVSGFAAVRVLGGGAAAGYAAQALIAALACAVLVRVVGHGSRDGRAATAAAATLLASPFLLDYDLVALAIPLAWLLGEGLRRGFQAWEKAILVAGFALPLIARDLAMIAHLPIAPAVMLALLWATARAACLRPQIIAMPPLTCSVCPVTYPASFDAR